MFAWWGRSDEHELVRVPDRGLEHADVTDAAVLHLSGDVDRVVGDQGDDRVPRGDVRHQADEPVLADHRLVQLHALIGARVDLDVVVPQRRVVSDHVRGHGSYALTPMRVVELDELIELWFWIAAPWYFATSAVQRRDLLAELVSCDLAWKVELKKPAMSRTGVSTVLAPCWIGDRTVTIPRCTLCRGPPVSFAEIGAEEDQGYGDEQRENCAPAPDLLVVHGEIVSKVVLRSELTVPGSNLVASAAVS